MMRGLLALWSIVAKGYAEANEGLNAQGYLCHLIGGLELYKEITYSEARALIMDLFTRPIEEYSPPCPFLTMPHEGEPLFGGWEQRRDWMNNRIEQLKSKDNE